MVKYIVALMVVVMACDTKVDPQVDLLPLASVGEFEVEETVYAAGT